MFIGEHSQYESRCFPLLCGHWELWTELRPPPSRGKRDWARSLSALQYPRPCPNGLVFESLLAEWIPTRPLNLAVCGESCYGLNAHLPSWWHCSETSLWNLLDIKSSQHRVRLEGYSFVWTTYFLIDQDVKCPGSISTSVAFTMPSSKGWTCALPNWTFPSLSIFWHVVCLSDKKSNYYSAYVAILPLINYLAVLC